MASGAHSKLAEAGPVAGRVLDAIADGQILYQIAFALYLVQHYLSITRIDVILPITKDVLCAAMCTVALVILAAKVAFTQRTTPLRWAACALLVGAGGVVYAVSGYGAPFWMAVLIVSAKDVPLSRLAWTALVSSAACCALSVSLSLADAIPNVVYHTAGKGTISSLGYVHPNSFGNAVYQIAAAVCAVCAAGSLGAAGGSGAVGSSGGSGAAGSSGAAGGSPAVGGMRRRWPLAVALAAVVAGCLACALVSGTRTALLAIFLVGFLVLSLPLWSRSLVARRALAVVFCAVALACIAGSIWLMAAYDPDDTVMTLFNQILSGRLGYAHTYHTALAPSLFGNTENAYCLASGQQRFIVDNAYCRWLMRGGIVVFALLAAGILCVYVRAIRHGGAGLALSVMTVDVVSGFTIKAFTQSTSFSFIALAAAALFGTVGELEVAEARREGPRGGSGGRRGSRAGSGSDGSRAGSGSDGSRAGSGSRRGSRSRASSRSRAGSRSREGRGSDGSRASSRSRAGSGTRAGSGSRRGSRSRAASGANQEGSTPSAKFPKSTASITRSDAVPSRSEHRSTSVDTAWPQPDPAGTTVRRSTSVGVPVPRSASAGSRPRASSSARTNSPDESQTGPGA